MVIVHPSSIPIDVGPFKVIQPGSKTFQINTGGKTEVNQVELSSAIEKEKLTTPEIVFAKYHKLAVVSRAPTLAIKLAREAYFGDRMLSRCSLVPRPSHPSVCRLQYQRGGRPGKTESRGTTYLDVWRSGTFLEKQQVSALPITNTDHRTTERSTSDSLGDVSWIQIAAL